MKFQFSYRKIDKKEKQALRELVGKELSALEEILGSLDSEAAQLEGAIERHGNKKLYRARLKLHLPGRSLAALEESHDSNTVIREVFAEMRRQVERFKHLSKNDYLWKRPRRRAELRNLLKEQASGGQGDRRKEYIDLIQPHLPELYHFIRRELAYHQAVDDLAPSDASADEILDATIVRGYEAFEARPERLEVFPWLSKLALEVIQEEIDAHRIRTLRVATEERVPEEPMDVTDDFDTEYYEFHQPDEVIRMEDILPNPESPIPEEAEEIRKRNLLVHDVLALLPKRWRHALVLMDIHGLSESVSAEVIGIEPDQLRQMRSCAERFMHEWLAQRIGPDEIEDTTTQELLGSPLREPLPEELEAEILEKFMPME